MGFANWIISALLLLQSAQGLPPQALAQVPGPKGTGQITGSLVDDKSGRALPYLAVVLIQTPGVSARRTTSDAQGRFVFSELPPGRYNISVTRGASTGVATADRARTAVELADGAHVDVGVLHIPAGQDISGQILDEHGKPLVSASVSVLRLTYLAPGERRLFTAGRATADANGEFRIANLRPGRYFIEAHDPSTPTPTFHPGVTDAARAQPVNVTDDAGAFVTLQLMPSSLARVSGTVVNSRGAPGSAFIVLLAPVRDDGAQVGGSKVAEVTEAGTFSIGDVSPGVYSVNVAAKARMERMAQSGSSGVGTRIEGEESGAVQVTVDGRDVDNVMITTTPLETMTGKITVDGAGLSAELAKSINVVVSGRSIADAMGSALQATFGQPNADGTFTMPIVPGARLLRVISLPRGTFLKRTLVNGLDVTDEGFDVVGEIRDARIELTTKPAHVDGHVHDSRGVPQAGVGVIVFADDARKWTLAQNRRVMSTKTDKDGAFSLSALPSGSYFIATVPQLIDGEWASPDNLESLRRFATAFTLGDGEQKTLTLIVR